MMISIRTLMALALTCAFFGLGFPIFANAQGVAIGYELLTEAHNTETNTYSVTFEVWNEDRDAQELTVSATAEHEDLQVLTKSKTWSGRLQKGKRYKHTVSAQVTGKETRQMIIEITRRAEKRTDSKKVTVLVAPR